MKNPTRKEQKLVIQKDFTVKNGESQEPWCICGEELKVPKGLQFEKIRKVDGSYSDKYKAYLYESDELQAKNNGFEKGKGMHCLISDFEGLKPYLYV